MAVVADEQLKYELDEKCRQLEEGGLVDRWVGGLVGSLLVLKQLHTHTHSHTNTYAHTNTQTHTHMHNRAAAKS